MSELEQIYQDIDSLPEEAKIIRKKKTLYEKFEESGLIGCCSVEEDLSTNYKKVLADTLASKYDHR